MPRASALLAIALVAAFVVAEGPPEDPFLAMGTRQVRDGDFEAAVFTLDAVVRRLSGEPARVKELARAYVYLGTAYVGLEHEDAAKGKFREALKLDPDLRLSPDEFPPRVIKVFETQVLKRTVAAKKRGAKTFLILGGVGAAAAVGISAATSEGGPIPNRPPTAAIGVAPEGQVLSGVTTITFTASASDPDGDPLSYRWDFGDGGLGSEVAVTHVYQTEGTFAPSLTVTDGRGGTVTARASVTARTLSGAWEASGYGCCPDGPGSNTQHRCVQTGAMLDCAAVTFPARREFFVSRWRGTLTHPRGASLELVIGNPPSQLEFPCLGEASSDLDTVSCLASSGVTFTFGRK